MSEDVDLTDVDEEVVVHNAKRKNDGTLLIEARVLVYLDDGTYSGVYRMQLEKQSNHKDGMQQ